MRTFIAVIVGLGITGLLIFIGDTSFARVTDATAVPGYPGTSHNAEVVALLWTFISISLGALVSVRINKTKETVAGFVLGELFFGAGLLHQFWHGASWYTVLAMLLIIPGALLGVWMGSQLRLGRTAAA